MSVVGRLKKIVIEGGSINRKEAVDLYGSPLNELRLAANDLRTRFCGNTFDLCTIINGKSGICSEDCKYCAQSVHYRTDIHEYPLMEAGTVLKEAVYNEIRGVLRFSIVTSGRNLNDREVEMASEIYSILSKNCGMSLCASHGLLTFEQLKKLKESGVIRYHNNLETSRRYFPEVCTTHSYEDKIRTIKYAVKAGLDVCSGGIMGLGESVEDRVDMAIELRRLGIRSVPLNLLNPIKGTPTEGFPPITAEEAERIVATYRFILPDASIRMAGGRLLLRDKGKSLFLSGANSAITGDMLTTRGTGIREDIEMLKDLGFEVRRHE
jgi:biotin synthase